MPRNHYGTGKTPVTGGPATQILHRIRFFGICQLAAGQHANEGAKRTALSAGLPLVVLRSGLQFSSGQPFHLPTQELLCASRKLSLPPPARPSVRSPCGP